MNETNPQPIYSTAPDDDVLIHLSKVYSYSHETMYLGAPCSPGGETFPEGITNGADWYTVTGKLMNNCDDIIKILQQRMLIYLLFICFDVKSQNVSHKRKHNPL